MLKVRINDNEAINIPAKVAKKLALKEGTVIEARVEKGRLLILRKKKDKIAKIMQYAGMWENEKVDEVFREIRRKWERWQKRMPA
ncbi:MAG: AbrB/MazE/SpoVT family DNA-binding domain-containing protein [Nitrospirae bacterium]|nr:AbrB/MazE/SpoVT family DNA-binding domain-containing protein [Nitrospirota bacterium]